VHSLDGKSPVSLPQAALWGLGRTLALEQPQLWGGLVDLDPEASAGQAAGQLVDEAFSAEAEDQLAYRAGVRHVARLRANPRLAQPAPVTLVEDATYLLTGGLGDLGSAVARALAGQGARHLALVQRKAAPEPGSPAEASILQLEAQGVKVHILAADVAREDEVARVLAEVRKLPPLRGVVHAAGVLDDGILAQLDAERLERVLAPKVSGAWNLHRGTLSDPLDFFVLFSSMGSLLGSPGQANYTAANAGLDAVAHLRVSEGLPGLSINWGPWSEVGMAAAQSNRGQRAAGKGFPGILPDQGTAILLHLLGTDRPQVGAVNLDLDQLRQSWPQVAGMPVLAEVVGAPAPPAPVAAEPEQPERHGSPEEAGILARIQQSPVGGRNRILDDYLREQTARVLQLSVADVDSRQPLNRMGIDSLMSVELRNRIESDLKVNVPLVSFLEGDSLDDLAAAIRRQIGGPPEEDESLERALQQIEQMSDEEVEALLAQKRQQLAP
jgi:NADP-dependent 3-hydroxy acid dehydrogenase YdfG/acyl carrier protein